MQSNRVPNVGDDSQDKQAGALPLDADTAGRVGSGIGTEVLPKPLPYRALDGSHTFGEVWSPGPLANTLWVLDANRKAHVVGTLGATKGVEQPYDIPPFPSRSNRPDAETRARAADIAKRGRWAHDSYLKKVYGSTFDSPPPTKEEYDWAQQLSAAQFHQATLDNLYHDAHHATTVSRDRFLTLAGYVDSNGKPPRVTPKRELK